MNILDFVFRTKCKICRIQITKGALCPFCVERLNNSVSLHERTITVQQRVIPAYYIFEYNNRLVKDLLFALKRNGNKKLYEFAASLYSKALPDCTSMTAVVNVPRTKKNINKYGYDHVKEPCKEMCKNHENFVYANILKRRGRAVEQKNLNAEKRVKNVTSKFKAVKKDIPENILLVDDVVTTANTVKECISELLKIYPNANIKCIFLSSQNYQTVPA